MVLVLSGCSKINTSGTILDECISEIKVIEGKQTCLDQNKDWIAASDNSFCVTKVICVENKELLGY